MDQQTILSKVWDLVDEIKTTDEYLLLEQKTNQLTSGGSKDLYHTYITTRTKYFEVLAIGRFHPDFKTTQKAFQAAKMALFQTEEYRQYLQAKEAYTQLLQTITTTINQKFAGLTVEKTKSCHVRAL